MILNWKVKATVLARTIEEWPDETDEHVKIAAVPVGTDVTTLPRHPDADLDWPESWLEAAITYYGLDPQREPDLWVDDEYPRCPMCGNRAPLDDPSGHDGECAYSVD